MTILTQFQGLKIIFYAILLFVCMGAVVDVAYDVVHADSSGFYDDRATGVIDTLYGWFGHTITIAIGAAGVFILANSLYKSNTMGR